MSSIAFRVSNARSKVRLRNLEVLKHQDRLNDIKKVMRDNFSGCKTLNKVNPIYFEGKLKEAKFHWGLERLKPMYLEMKFEEANFGSWT